MKKIIMYLVLILFIIPFISAQIPQVIIPLPISTSSNVVINSTLNGYCPLGAFQNITPSGIQCVYFSDVSVNNSNYLNGYSYNYFATNSSLSNYYPLSNPYGFYNSTNPSPETSWIANYSTFLTHITWTNIVNGTIALSSDLQNYYPNYSNPKGYYNSTTIPNFIYWSNAVNGTLALNSSFSTYAYSPNNDYSFYNSTTIPNFIYWSNAINGTLALNSSLGTYCYSTNNPSGYITWANAINGTIINGLTSWANIVNGTMASWSQVMNGTVITASGIGNWSADKVSYGTWANVMNGTVTSGLANVSVGNNFTQIQNFSAGANMSNQNLTYVNCITFKSGGLICSA